MTRDAPATRRATSAPLRLRCARILAGPGLALVLAPLVWPAGPAAACGPEWSPPIPIAETFPYRVLDPASTHRARVLTILWHAFTQEVELPPRPSAQKLQADAQALADAYRARIGALSKAAGVEIAMPRDFARQRNGYHPCESNTLAAMSGFLDAVQTAPALAPRPGDRAELVSLRHAIREHGCARPDAEARARLHERIAAAQGVEATARFATYLHGALAFYHERYEDAEAVFRSLVTPEDDWLSDTAAYMTARTLLVGAQHLWPHDRRAPAAEQEEARVRRKAGLGAARAAFADYLAAPGRRRYAASAVGLRRFTARVLGDHDELDRELVGLHAALRGGSPSIPAEERRSRLIEVIQQYRGSSATAGPTLYLAALHRSGDPAHAPGFALQQVESQRRRFEEIPGLYEYTRAVLLWRTRQLEALVGLELPKSPPAPEAPALAIAATAIRARALEALGRHGEAVAVWRNLVATTADEGSRIFVESRVLDNALRAGQLVGLFAADAPAIDPRLRRTVFEGVLDQPQLETLLADLDVTGDARRDAAHALLHRLLFTEQHARFLEVYDGLEDRGNLSQVETAVRGLLRDPGSAKALVNVGYFLMHHGLVPDPWVPEGLDQLPGAVARREETLRQPMDYYERAIELTAQAPPSADEAKALHYAVRCFGAGSRAARCWWRGRPYPENPSKQYFERLHTRYPGSRWAERTPYYY